MEIINWNEILMPYENIVKELIVKFDNISKEFLKIGKHSPIESVCGRVKSISSILEKANKKNISYDEIENHFEDIAGIRIICKFVEDIKKIVEIIKLRNNHDFEIISETDYITNRKESGYRSYHLIVKYPIFVLSGKKELCCEIQIRTVAMNFWSTTEHSLKYKYNGKVPMYLQKKLSALSEAAFNLDKEMSTIRGEILEVQKIIQQKNNLVDKILKKIDKLYYIAKLDDVNILNREFLTIYSEDNLDKLHIFNEKLNMIMHLYKHCTIK